MSKKQNAAIGAVIGGALLGPLGVAVGAAMGAISTDESVSLDNNLLQSDIDIQEKMKKIISPYSSDDFYKAEKSIPQKKLEAAILNYPVPRQETILALVDATLFGSAKNGLVIGLQGIYWKNDWTTETTKNFLSWDEMVESSKSISTTLLTSDVVFGNGCVFNMSSSQMKTKTLAELLNKLVLLHKQKYIQQNTKPKDIASSNLINHVDNVPVREKTHQQLNNAFIEKSLESTFFYKNRREYKSFLQSEKSGLNPQKINMFMSLYDSFMLFATGVSKSKYGSKELSCLVNDDKVLFHAYVYVLHVSQRLLSQYMDETKLSELVSPFVVVGFSYASNCKKTQSHKKTLGSVLNNTFEHLADTDMMKDFKRSLREYNSYDNLGETYELFGRKLYGTFSELDNGVEIIEYIEKHNENIFLYFEDYMTHIPNIIEDILIKGLE